MRGIELKKGLIIDIIRTVLIVIVLALCLLSYLERDILRFIALPLLVVLFFDTIRIGVLKDRIKELEEGLD